MPRKPKPEAQHVDVLADGKSFTVGLYPPSGRKTSWYCYWNGLPNGPRSTGKETLDGAKAAAGEMLLRWMTGGATDRPQPADAVLSDAEFEAVQRHHYGKRGDPAAERRAAKSLVTCLEAIRAFQKISGLNPISTATPDDCARFQREALAEPRNWRSKHPNSKEPKGTLTPTTVAKWSRALAAAFERCNRNAGNKCVRGVVAASKLLDSNPWRGFSWSVTEAERPIRQFDAAELTGLLDFFAAGWPGVTAAPAAAKVLFWTACRKEEVMGLTWSQYRPVNGEHHFDVTGKWGVRRWVRVPHGLFADLQALRVGGDGHVFAAYNPQLRDHLAASPHPWEAKRVGDSYDAGCFGRWLYNRVKGWAADAPGGQAYLHVFRKTSLQFARDGDDAGRRLASDAGVNEAVLLGHYVREEDRHLRVKSNAMFARLAAALPAQVSTQLGHAPPPSDPLRDRLEAAVKAGDFDLVARLASELAKRERSSAV